MAKKKVVRGTPSKITDIIETFIKVDGVEMIKQEFYEGKKKVDEKIVKS